MKIVLFFACRGLGLIIGIELVQDKTSRKPAKEAAELLAYK